MLTSTMIVPTAEVTRIVSLKKGDVFKRLDTEQYSSTKDEIRYGVVLDVLNNGTETAVTVVEFAVDYARVTPKIRTFRGTDDLAIFPATPEEVRLHMGEVLEKADKAVQDAERELENKRVLAATIRDVFDRRGSLTAPVVTKEIEAA